MAPPSSPDGLAGAADHRSLEQAADWYVRLHADAAGSADWQQWRAWLDRSPRHQAAWGYIESVSQRFAPLRAGEPRAASAGLQAALAPPRRRHLRTLALLSGGVLGFYALIYMFAGFLNGFFKRIFFPDEVRLPVILIALSDFGCNLVIYFILFWFRGRFEFGYYLLHIILPELVYTMVVAILLYFILLKINQKLEEIERRSEAKFG